MVGKILSDRDYILVSHSPRRRQLLEELGLQFRLAESSAEEVCPAHLTREEIPLYLSNLKAEGCVVDDMTEKSLLIAADTIVWAGGKALGKPHDAAEAREMLQTLSGKTHEVITGVTLKSLTAKRQFHNVSKVTFADLDDEEVDYYIRQYRPFDKAGAYGIQEWIGLMGVKGIEGCFYNVMGLPVQHLYAELKKWAD